MLATSTGSGVIPSPVFWFFKGNPAEFRPPRVHDETGARSGKPHIRCPACAWEPRQDDFWSCVCLYSWHTFDTGGVCPSCDRRWTETQCLKCHAWSRHLDWYTDDDEDVNPV